MPPRRLLGLFHSAKRTHKPRSRTFSEPAQEVTVSLRQVRRDTTLRAPKETPMNGDTLRTRRNHTTLGRESRHSPHRHSDMFAGRE